MTNIDKSCPATRILHCLVTTGFCFLLASIGLSCSNGGYSPCISRCADKKCGDDGCGGSCGECDDGYFCTDLFVCEQIEECVSDCFDKECGDDGCGGSCGSCAAGRICSDTFICEHDMECKPDCTDKECGADGCGGVCGLCDEGLICSDVYVCEQCFQNCEGRLCGDDDGCGGLCVECPSGMCCSEGHGCVEEGEGCFEDCCAHDVCGNSCPRVDSDGRVCDMASCDYKESYCSIHPELPQCDDELCAPTGSQSISEWIVENAHPLRCSSGQEIHYNFDILYRDSEDFRVFFFGEYHGTNELGPMSAEIFKYLARAGRVNAMTAEVGMDMTDAMQEYVRTGAGPIIDKYRLFRERPERDYSVVLLKAARELYLEGIEIHVYGSDIPVDLYWVNAEIEEIALQMDTPRKILDNLPPAQSSLSRNHRYFNDVDNYYNSMWRDLAEICSQLDEDACARFEALIRGLWSAVFVGVNGLNERDSRVPLFFSRREPVIMYNFAANTRDESTRTYAHYGAAHVALNATEPLLEGPSVAFYLYDEYAPTRGSVYTVNPAYGSNSEAWYGREIVRLPTDLSVISSALSPSKNDAYWVSARAPGPCCRANPLRGYTSQSRESLCYSIECGEAFYAHIYFHRLTPDIFQPSPWLVSGDQKPGPGELFRNMREAIESVRAEIQ